MTEIIICKTEEEMEGLGRRIGLSLKGGEIVALTGPLGAGKTVFTRGVARSLGIEEAIVSPTFTIVQEYDGSLKMTHIDLYRIASDEEFEEMGGEDMLYTDGVCLIEWPGIIGNMLPKERTISVLIEVNEDLSRTVRIERK